MSVKIIYFVNGTTTDNLEHKSTGWLDGNLSEKGIEQSVRLREKINLNEIDLVISSDLKRAIDSAKNIFKDSKVILHDKRIRECNYGDLNGKDTFSYTSPNLAFLLFSPSKKALLKCGSNASLFEVYNSSSFS